MSQWTHLAGLIRLDSNWLIVEGFYDDIQATKQFSKEVIRRLKGK